LAGGQSDRSARYAFATSLSRAATGLVREFEKALIRRALAHTAGHRMEAAQWLVVAATR
jgi:DNA-binding NtrC family response regulator